MSDEAAAQPVRYRDAKPRQRRAFRIVVAVLSVVVLAVLVVVADISVRAYVEQRVATEIRKSLPSEVGGDLEATVGGFAVIPQLIAGQLDDVHVASKDLTLQGAAVSAVIDLRGVPLDAAGSVESARGTLRLGEDAVSQLVAARGVEGTFALGDGRLSYTNTTEVFGQDLDVTVVTRPVLDTGRIVFRAESADLSVGGLGFDATKLLDLLVPDGISVCVAQYLPASVQLDSVDIEGDAAVVGFSAEDLALSGSDQAADAGI